MIISSLQVRAVLNAKNESEKRKAIPTLKERPSAADRFEPSAELRMLYTVKEAVRHQTEVRPEKVALLKSMIAKGDYPISGSEVADKMINRSLVDNILLSDASDGNDRKTNR